MPNYRVTVIGRTGRGNYGHGRETKGMAKTEVVQRILLAELEKT